MLPEPLFSALHEVGLSLAKLSESLTSADRTDINESSLEAIAVQIRSAKTAIDTLSVMHKLMSDVSIHWRTKKKLIAAQDQAFELAGRLTLLESAIAAYDGEKSSRTALISALTFAGDDLSLCSGKFLKLAKHYDPTKYYAKSATQKHEEPKFDRVEESTQVRLNDVKGRFDSPRFSRILSSDFPSPGTEFSLSKYLSFRNQDNALQMTTLVQVMFATDRDISAESRPGKITFRNGRGRGDLTYGVAEVSIPPNHKMGRIERPSIWKFQFSEDSRKHVVITDARVQSLDDWMATARNRLDISNENSALVFIHGFNVSFDEAIRNAAQLGHDLQFPGLITAYSWGSEGKLASYMTDGENVVLTIDRLCKYLLLLSTQLGIKEIHIIAHSMGNRALVEALSKLPPGNASVGEVVFAAPDIDADVFKDTIARLKGKAKRYTLYGSEYDKALVVSKGIRNGHPRAGDGGANIVVVNGVETIDASAVGDDLLGLGHSYFSSERTLLSDLYYVIRQSLHPDKRATLTKQQIGTAMYWCFVP